MDSLKKWTIIGIIIGIVVGFVSIAIYYGIILVQDLFMSDFVGYNLPLPVGEGGSLAYTFFVQNYWLLPVSIFVGALISGVIVYKFAPETEGHGSDAVINAYHNEGGNIRRRVPLVKLLTAALTIGSGGSAGREGPTAQVAAGIGNIISKYLDISKSDRRNMTAIAMGAGIGAIFRAPFGGALLSAEILYRRDMETEVIFPSIIASVIGYTILGAFAGYSPIFEINSSILNYVFTPYILPFLVVVGIFTGAFARFYIKMFYFVREKFRDLKVKNYMKPAIGAIGTGAIVLAFPEVAGIGYGWMQLMMSGDFNAFVNTFGMPLVLFFLVLAIMKMVAASASVASGGSGGVFAPGMFAGSSIGVCIALLFATFFPELMPISLVGAFAVIGMLSFFGAAGKVPIAVTVMVIEMTGTIALLPAAMFSIAIALIVSGKDSIYRAQVATRLDSPAHISEYYSPLMKKVKVNRVITRNMALKPDARPGFAEEFMKTNDMASAPIVDGRGRLLGAAYLEDVVRMSENNEHGKVVSVLKRIKHVPMDSTADAAWKAMVRNKATWCAVADHNRYLGIVRMSSVFRKYSRD
jgi:CIC family chloride channel protein